MKERPILFSGEMIRAILEGRKTQTRRTIKPQPRDVLAQPSEGKAPSWAVTNGPTRNVGVCINEYGNEDWLRCPYGQPGDRLWVRETWRADYEHGENTRGEIPPAVEYRADTGNHGPADGSADTDSWNWKPSIFMPRWASRITLEVTGIRVERVRDISEAAAYAEGIPEWTNAAQTFSPVVRFHELWDQINSKRPGCAWSDNPWVWVVEFKRIAP